MSSRPVRLVRPLVVAVAGLVLLASAGSARADMINFSGSGGTSADPVKFNGTVTVTAAADGTSALVRIMLTNTTTSADPKAYGYITGFGFNLANSLSVTNVTGSSSDTDFKFLKNGSAATGLQAGPNDYAFSLSASQLHTIEGSGAKDVNQIKLGLGANPQQSATFELQLTGSGLNNLSAADIINDDSGSGKRLSVRFRSINSYKYQGFFDGDKVEAYKVDKPTPPNGVPAPPGLVLAGIGFGSLLLGRLRRR